MLARPLVGEHVRPFGSYSEAACSVLSEVPRQIRGRTARPVCVSRPLQTHGFEVTRSPQSEGGQVSAFDAALLMAAGE